MIWTIVCFLITFFVLKRYAFGPIQKMIDERRERIRAGARRGRSRPRRGRKLLEEHRAMMAEASGKAEEILVEARKVAEAQKKRMRDETEDRPPAAARGDGAARSSRRPRARSS